MTTSTVPTAAKRKEMAIVTVRHVGAPRDRPRRGEPRFLAIAPAGKVVVRIIDRSIRLYCI
jgi:hypothetical protein